MARLTTHEMRYSPPNRRDRRTQRSGILPCRSEAAYPLGGDG